MNLRMHGIAESAQAAVCLLSLAPGSSSAILGHLGKVPGGKRRWGKGLRAGAIGLSESNPESYVFDDYAAFVTGTGCRSVSDLKLWPGGEPSLTEAWLNPMRARNRALGVQATT